MIVADTNLVLYLLIEGQFTKEVEAVRARDKTWIVPALFRHELMNGLVSYVSSDRLERDEAVRFFRHGMALVRMSQRESDPAGIFNLCRGSKCSGYDAEFVWLAQTMGLSLVTADQELIREFPDVAVGIPQFARG